jgi:hypothetical protein
VVATLVAPAARGVGVALGRGPRRLGGGALFGEPPAVRVAQVRDVRLLPLELGREPFLLGIELCDGRALLVRDVRVLLGGPVRPFGGGVRPHREIGVVLRQRSGELQPIVEVAEVPGAEQPFELRPCADVHRRGALRDLSTQPGRFAFGLLHGAARVGEPDLDLVEPDPRGIDLLGEDLEPVLEVVDRRLTRGEVVARVRVDRCDRGERRGQDDRSDRDQASEARPRPGHHPPN